VGIRRFGRLGHKEQKDEFLPRKIDNIRNFTPVTLIAAGGAFSLAVGAHGVLYAWGKVKQTGDSIMYPQPVNDLSGWNVTLMSCGAQSLSVVGDGKAIAWGNGQHGQLGFGPTQKSSALPKLIDPLEGISIMSISCGSSHTLFLVEPSPEVEKLPKHPKGCPICKKSELDSKMGDTVKCNTCHVKFHQKCVNLKSIPKSGWTCENCEVVEDQCGICKNSTEPDPDEEDNVVLICDGCDGEFHKRCIDPPLEEVPEGDWFCSKCAAPTKEPAKKKRKI